MFTHLLHIRLLSPPSLGFVSLPFVVIAIGTFQHRLLGRGLPRLAEMSVAQVSLELCDIGAEAVVPQRELARSCILRLAGVDAREQCRVGGAWGQHGNEFVLLSGRQTGPCVRCEKEVVGIGGYEAAGRVCGDVCWVEDSACWLLGFGRG
jgi:hypothetical protein